MLPTEIPPVGSKVILKRNGIGLDGKPYTQYIQGTIASNPYPHGYLSKGGSWSLYPSEGDEQCWKVYVRRYKERKVTVMIVNRLESCKVGWEP